MKNINYLIAAALIFACCFVVSAQTYRIRANRGLNLRASGSLQADIVGGVRAGAELVVVGSEGRWLQVRLANGETAWLANWVDFSRVDEAGSGSSSQPQPPAADISTQVDNCCFVDRQCATDKEWTDGYWAYQNGQCQTAQISQTQTSSQPVANHLSLALPRTASNAATLSKASFDFNNCCYMPDSGCQSSNDWTNGYWAYQNHHCVHPAPIPTRPVIEGNGNFVTLIVKALGLLEIHAPEWLNYVYSSGLRKVKMTEGGVGHGGFANRIWEFHWSYEHIDNPGWDPTYDEILGMAGVIVHEACHSWQQRTVTYANGWQNELPCLEAQVASLRAIDPGHRWVDAIQRYVDNIRDPSVWWWD